MIINVILFFLGLFTLPFGVFFWILLYMRKKKPQNIVVQNYISQPANTKPEEVKSAIKTG